VRGGVKPPLQFDGFEFFAVDLALFFDAAGDAQRARLEDQGTVALVGFGEEHGLEGAGLRSFDATANAGFAPFRPEAEGSGPLMLDFENGSYAANPRRCGKAASGRGR